MIDAYAHCGISKYQPVEAVREAMDTAGVDRAVLVQHLGEYDNRYIEQVVAGHPGVFAGVALIDPQQDAWEAQLATVAHSPSFRGLRLTADMMATNREIGVAAVGIGLVPVLYTPEGVGSAAPLVVELATARPGEMVVISHLGCPRVEGGRVVDGRDLLELADLDNVMVTLSGQAMFCPYPHHPLAGFVREVIEAFGAERIMWGSNFPLVGGPADYARDLGLVRTGSWDLTAEQIARITTANAAATFFTPEREDASSADPGGR